MPRAASKSTEEKVAAKAAPRKRAAPKKAIATKSPPRKRAAPKKPTTKSAPQKPAARKPRAKPKTKIEQEPIEEVEEGVDVETEIEHTQVVQKRVRKAPTKFTAVEAEKKSKQKQYIIIGVLMVLGIGSSALVGFSDEEAGQINVSQVIQDRNERMANLVDVDGPVVTAPVPSSLPNGGLSPSTRATPPPAPSPDPATTTATSSDMLLASSSATSTPDNSDQVIPDDESSDVDSFATDFATTTVEATDPSAGQ